MPVRLRFQVSLALLGAALLALSAVPMAAVGQGSGSSSLTVTVNPDGSLSVAVQTSNTTTSPPNTVPNVQFSASVATSGGQSVATEHLTATVPSAYLNRINVTGSLSGHGTFANDQSQGTITFNGAPGIGSPDDTLSLNYNGTKSSLDATGTVTIVYGTYTVSGQTVDVTQSNVSQYVSLYQAQLNRTYINGLITSNPVYAAANVTVTGFSITPNYGSSSAAINVDIELAGNFTALPGAEAAYYCAHSNLTSCSSNATLYDAIDSAVTGYTYSFGYSNGSFTFDATVTGPANFNLDAILRAEAASSPASGNLTAAQRAFFNSTSVDITGLTTSGSVSQDASGVVTTQFSMSGLTLRPTVTISNGGFDESGFFSSLGTTPVNITVQTSGGVALTLPSGVPAPSSQTSTSASWTNVSGRSLSPMAFTGGSASTTSGKTTGSSSGLGGIPEFPIAPLGLALLTAAVLAGYLIARKNVRPKLAVP